MFPEIKNHKLGHNLEMKDKYLMYIIKKSNTSTHQLHHTIGVILTQFWKKYSTKLYFHISLQIIKKTMEKY